MNSFAINDVRFEKIPSFVFEISTGQAMVWSSDSKIKLLISPESFAALEMAHIAEVESVFVDRPDNRKDVFRVITVINERDQRIREMVYEKERTIIDAYPELEFNFRLITRNNRHLCDVIERAGTIVFQR